MKYNFSLPSLPSSAPTINIRIFILSQVSPSMLKYGQNNNYLSILIKNQMLSYFSREISNFSDLLILSNWEKQRKEINKFYTIIMSNLVTTVRDHKWLKLKVMLSYDQRKTQFHRYYLCRQCCIKPIWKWWNHEEYKLWCRN